MATTKMREGWGLPGVLPVPVHLRQASTVETLTPIVGPDALQGGNEDDCDWQAPAARAS